MKEFDEFRFVLANLREIYPGKEFITIKDISEHEPCDPKTAKKRYGIPKGAGGLDIAVLARRKCLLGR